MSYLIKLVRDDIQGAVPNVEHDELFFYGVGRTTHVRLLKQKLIEEAGEYLTAADEGDKVNELIDLMEVIDALAAVDIGISRNELHAAKLAKLRERGGFMRGTGMFAQRPVRHNQDSQQGEGK